MESKEEMTRWAFNFENWKPTSTEWGNLLSFIQLEERVRIGKFKRPIGKSVYLTGKDNPDAKSSLVGRLMQRKMVHKYQNISNNDIKLERTTKGKPYFAQSQCRNIYPNFNFNVSHQGDFVVGGCEAEWLFGIDVMKVEYRGQRSGSNEEFFRDMRDCFTESEWNVIENYKNPLESFYQHWCLKEGYIKAIGIGLGFELQRAQFKIDFEKNNEATVAISETIGGIHVTQNNWHFELHELPNQHVAAVAYGPPSEADSSSSDGINMKHNIMTKAIDIKRIPFKIISIDELLLGMSPLK